MDKKELEAEINAFEKELKELFSDGSHKGKVFTIYPELKPKVVTSDNVVYVDFVTKTVIKGSK